MKHTYLFFGEKISEGVWELRDDEVFHLKNVLRLKAGSRIELTDGRGLKACGHINDDGKTCAIDHASFSANDHGKNGRLILVQAIIKKELVEEVLPSLVELGVDELFFYLQAHAPRGIFSPKLEERAHRIVESAMKQSKRANKPEVRFFSQQDECFRIIQDFAGLKILFSPVNAVDCSSVKFAKEVLAVCGSEAGFTETEENYFRMMHFISLKIAAPVLRARTASIVGSGLILAHMVNLN